MSPFLKEAIAAVKSGDQPALAVILAKHPQLAKVHDPNSEYEPGYTLLHYAASADRAECSERLIAAGADPDALTQGKATALHFAASHGHSGPIEVLLRSGADATLTAAGEGGTPLVWALFYGKTGTAEILAAHHRAPDNLRVAAGLGDVKRLARFFGKDGELKAEAGQATEFQRPHEGFPARPLDGTPADLLNDALGYASRNGRIGAVEFLIEHGADINDGRYFGITAVHHAAYWNQAEMLDHLIGLGGDPDRVDEAFQATAYGWAMYKGNPEIADRLVALGRVGILDAAHRGNLEHVRQILAKNPTALHTLDSRSGGTLHQAVSGGHAAMVSFLLAQGADPSIETAQGITPRALADKLENREIAELLDRHASEHS